MRETQGSANLLQTGNAFSKANLTGVTELSKSERDDSYVAKRNNSFKNPTSNFDRLYNKRIDFDRVAASNITLQDKEDYLNN